MKTNFEHPERVENPELIWESVLADGLRAEVRRLDENVGALLIRRGDRIVKTITVPASHVPTDLDVMYWQDLCSDYVEQLGNKF